MSEKIVGIYCYKDKENDDEIVYIGKDSNIHINKRHKEHTTPCKYNDQPFNRVLQNNSDRYEYEVLRTGEFTQNWLNALEIIYIRRYQPKFNFTVGGDGTVGFHHSEETKRKMSKIKKGKNNPFYGKQHSEETKMKMREAKTGESFKEQLSWDKCEKISTGNHAKIVKNGTTNQGKQKYCIKRNGKIIKQNIKPYKLLEWFSKQYPNEILQIKL